MITQFIKLLRVPQWSKNGFIFLPMFFAGKFSDTGAMVNAVIAFFAFSFAASSIYCFNDIWDLEDDRAHSRKSKRPLASGKLSVFQGYLAMFTMLALCIAVLIFSGLANDRILTAIFIVYYLMNIGYCVVLKNYPLIDMFIIAFGFVLRIFVGGVATSTILSHWIVQMTFLLALFLALAKRREDVVFYEITGVKPRNNTNRYNLDFMNTAIAVIASVTIVCYIMYTVSDEVIHRFNNEYLYITSVFVIAGIMRYLHLTMVDISTGSPTRVLLKDRYTQLCLLAWVISFVIIIYI